MTATDSSGPWETTLYDRFRAQAARTPDIPAVLFADSALTYRLLKQKADRLAHRLQGLGVGPDVPVALALDRSLDIPVAVLGVLAAGGAYVPIDPQYPAERIDYMLRDCGARVLITQARVADQLPAHELTTLAIETERESSHATAATAFTPAQTTPEHLGYIIYTSGSTGRPKGVAMRRGALGNLLDWQCRDSQMGVGDATLQFASLSFDVSFQEMFATWCTGGTLAMITEELRHDPNALLRLIDDKRIARLFLPVVVLHQLADAAADIDLFPSALQEIITAGEALQITPAVVRFFERLPICTLHNHYGPSETHVVTAFTLEGPPSSWPTLPPIGRPIPGCTVHIVDSALQLVITGEAGELLLGGGCLARGYVDRPDWTAERFIHWPEASGERVYRTGDLVRRRHDGVLEFLGRADDQVKICGHRVELGDVEAALRAHPAVKAAAVAANELTPGEKTLVGYIVPVAEMPSADELRRFLADRLPDAMMPSQFVALESLPLTPSGKVDRRALPAPERCRPELRSPFAPPRTSVEQAIAAIWQDVLRLDRVGIDDGFFDLGGTSLTLTRAHARLQSHFGPISIAQLFQHRTIRELAAKIVQSETQSAERITPSSVPRPRSSGFAVVGMAGQFPGASNIDEFWRNLCAGVESITVFSDEELIAAGIDPALVHRPEYVKARGLLRDAEGFDAAFFGYPPREAELIDPQHRLFLETAWAALEHAGYDPSRPGGSVGVFAGSSPSTYLLANVCADRDGVAALVSGYQSGNFPALFGNDKDYLATRVAYELDLRGPSVSVQTACSTALVAVAQACDALAAGRCKLALAGGVSITVPRYRGYLYQDGAMVSPDGHCRAFDAAAAGTVFGEGVGIVVLKRLDDAVADGDTIYAVIRGAGVTNDGSAKLSFTAPSVEGQAAAVRQALDQAGVSARSIGYVEAHGTGTPLGDPIEIGGLTQAFRADTADAGFCAIGSVKTNIGHLEAASGAAGLIKTVLALHHRQLPPTLHYESPNPQIDFQHSPFRVVDRLRDWPAGIEPRRAGVSSLGVGGTNAHVVLEEWPATISEPAADSPQLLVLSAKTATALDAMTARLADYLAVHSELSLADVAYTLQEGRHEFAHRRIAVATNTADAPAGLKDRSLTGTAVEQRRVGFLFPGQGAQTVDMARGLYEAEPAFRNSLDRCCEILKPHLQADLRTLLFPEPEACVANQRLDETAITQPALFAVEYALTQLWQSWGVSPTACFGHSIGEYVAACLAGVFSLEDALALVALRGRLTQSMPHGAMLAVRLPEADLAPLLPASLDLAAVNGPQQCVVSGPQNAIEAFERLLAERAIVSKRLTVSHAFHSAMLDPILEPFAAAVAKVRRDPPRVPFVSCVTGTWITAAEATDPRYWACHLRKPVRAADGLRTLASDGAVLLEVGPGTTLTNLAKGAAAASIASLPRTGDDRWSIREALGRLWLAGARIDWSRLHAPQRPRRVALPTYPFEHQRYWIEPEVGTPVGAASRAAPTAPLGSRGLQPRSDESPAKTKLQDLFAELAGVAPEALNPSATFFELGFDSLALTQAVVQIHKRFGIKVTFRQLLAEWPTIEMLAKYISDCELPIAASPAQSKPSANEIPEGFGALARVEHSRDAEWMPRQRQFIAALVERVARKTARSKQHVQQFRGVHADPRTVAGFTTQWKEMVYPLVIERSAGSRLWDIDGNEYIDLLNGFGPDLFGHSPPFIVDAVAAQLQRGYEVGPMSPLAGEVAQLICSLTGMERASFVCTGSEAVQAALRAARTVTGRDLVVLFARDYHGNFDEVLARPHPGAATPSAPGIPASAVQNVLVLDYGSDAALATIRERAHDLAAVLIEPVQSRRPEWQPREFIHQVRQITSQAGAALIFDEVITGFRLHPGGAQAFYGVPADLATYGKVIGGGMPFGVVAGRAAFMDAFDGGNWRYGDDSEPEAGRTFFAGTFVRHPLALAAARAALVHLRDAGPNLQADLNQKTARFVAELDAIAVRFGVPLKIVHCGSVMFFRVLEHSKAASLLFYLLRGKGVYILEGFPSYLSTAHSDADLRTIIEAFRASAAELLDAGFFGEAPPLSPARNGVYELPESRDFVSVPLTEAQREIWLAAQMGPEASCAYNESCHVRFTGRADSQALQKALQQLVDRHDALRATFDADGQTQRIHSHVAVDLVSVNLDDRPSRAGLDEFPRLRVGLATRSVSDGPVRSPTRSVSEEAGVSDGLAALLDAEDREPFDLARGPLLRAKLVQLSAEESVLVLTVHHIACDGWAYDILLRELGAIYSAYVAGNDPNLPPVTSFADYARRQAQWLHSPECEAIDAWWRLRFADPPPIVELPTDRPRPPERTYRGARFSATLGAELSHAVRESAARLGRTPYAMLFAAYHALLSRLSNQSDFATGIPTAGQALEGESSLVGHCVHFLPIRASTGGAFAEHVARIHAGLIDAFDHQRFTYARLLRLLALKREAAQAPLLAVSFNVDPELRDIEFQGLTCRVDKNPKHFVNFDLHVNLVEHGDDYLVECEYSTDLFDAATMERWLGHYRTLLGTATADPSVPTERLPILTPPERQRLVEEWNQTAKPYPERCIHELFLDQVQQTPDAIALENNESSLTYGDLNRRANRLARRLRELGVDREEIVAVCGERSLDLMVSLLAVLKAGGAYLPLSPFDPLPRLTQLVKDCAAKLVLVDRQLNLPAICVRLDEPLAGDDSDLPNCNSPDDLVYVMATSGSTGIPKCVAVPHRAVVRLLFGVLYCEFGPQHTIAQLAPIAFDASTFEIWGSLLHGGRCALFPGRAPAPAELGDFLKRHHVDTLFLTTGLFNTLVDADLAMLRGVRQLLTGGEAVSVAHVRRAAQGLPDTRIVHVYGPTETTTFATSWDVPRAIPADAHTLPIGRPIANTTAFVLDRNGAPVPIGVIGELHLGGSGVARGYVNRPDLTAERFIAWNGERVYRTGDRVRWRPDGTLEFVGRVDRQLKVRGFRIEPGELEAVLTKIPGVGASAVEPHPDPIGGVKLVAYVAPADPGQPLAADRVRTALRAAVPEFMLPAHILVIDRLPMTPTGKLDRRALPPPTMEAAAAGGFVEPRDDLERQLAALWREVLGIRRVSVSDDFFALGGHSLLAARLFARMREQFHRDLPLAVLFRTPTIAGLAEILRGAALAAPATLLIPLRQSGSRAPLFCAPGVGAHVFIFRELADRLAVDRPIIGLESRGLDGAAPPHNRIESMAAEYLAEIRSRYPSGPYHLAGYSLGGLIVFEIARQMTAAGMPVGLVAILDAHAPGHPRRLSRLKRLQIHARKFTELNWRGRTRYLVDRVANRLGRKRKKSDYEAQVRGAADLSAAARSVIDAHLEALHHYRPEPYPGRVQLFRSREQEAWSEMYVPDYTMGWGELVEGGLDLYWVGGGHLEMFHAAAVETLTRQLSDWLRNAP